MTLKCDFDQAERLVPCGELAPGQRALALWEKPCLPKAGLGQLSPPAPLGSLPEWLGLCRRGTDWEACQGSTLSSCPKCQGMGRAVTLSHSTTRNLFKVSFLLCHCPTMFQKPGLVCLASLREDFSLCLPPGPTIPWASSLSHAMWAWAFALKQFHAIFKPHTK